MTDRNPKRDFDIALVLSGGNALGAFAAGVYQALHEAGLLPDWIVGASIGAINGALIAGSAPERRIDTLRAFWQPTDYGLGEEGSPYFPSMLDVARRTAAATGTMFGGRSGMFGPMLTGLNPWSDGPSSIFGTTELTATLDRHIDFEILNTGPCRFGAATVDFATGDDVMFDTRRDRIAPDHIRASAAMPVAFPPIEIDGRMFVDGGLSANLPLDPVLAEAGKRPMLCLAVDLLPLSQAAPESLGDAAGRMQNLIFAAQSRRTIARWQAEYAGRKDISVALARIAYTDQAIEVSGKAFDYSGPTIERRWQAGHRAGLHAVTCVEAERWSIGAPGLNVVAVEN